MAAPPAARGAGRRAGCGAGGAGRGARGEDARRLERAGRAAAQARDGRLHDVGGRAGAGRVLAPPPGRREAAPAPRAALCSRRPAPGLLGEPLGAGPERRRGPGREPVAAAGPQRRAPWVPATLSPSAAQGAHPGRGRERRRLQPRGGGRRGWRSLPGLGAPSLRAVRSEPEEHRWTAPGQAVCVRAHCMPAEDPGPPQMRPARPALGGGPAAAKGRPHPRRLGSTPITGSRRLLTGTQWFEKGVMTLVLGMTLWVKWGTLGSLVRGGRSAN